MIRSVVGVQQTFYNCVSKVAEFPRMLGVRHLSDKVHTSMSCASGVASGKLTLFCQQCPN